MLRTTAPCSTPSLFTHYSLTQTEFRAAICAQQEGPHSRFTHYSLSIGQGALSARLTPRDLVAASGLTHVRWQPPEVLHYTAMHIYLSPRHLPSTHEPASSWTHDSLTIHSLFTQALRGEWDDERSLAWSLGDSSPLAHSHMLTIGSLIPAMAIWQVYSHGRIPFSEIRQDEGVVMKLSNGERPQRPKCCSGSLYRLLERCWSAVPSQRPTVQEVVDEIEQLDPISLQLELEQVY